MDIAEFLLARIAEDEAEAEAAIGEKFWIKRTSGSYPHIWRWQPLRVIAECEAKRQIIKLLGGYRENDVEYWALHDALQALALPYADHPDYQPEWSPLANR